MRLEELVLRISDDEFRVHFHEHLTVLSGIGLHEREALADSILRALAGSGQGTELRYRDNTGREVSVSAEAQGATRKYVDDHASALPLVGTVAPTEEHLRSLMMLRASDLGLTTNNSAVDEDPELSEARAMLRDLSRELRGAINGRHDMEALRKELEEVESRVARAVEDGARMEYAAALAQLEAAKAEASAYASSEAATVADQHLVASASRVAELVTEWRQTKDHAVDAQRVADAGDQVEDDIVAEASEVPNSPPADLHVRIEALGRARAARDGLLAAIARVGSSHVKGQTRPEVVRLASADQTRLWAAAERVEQTEVELKREQLALGGAGDTGAAEQVSEQLEASQRRVEDCEMLLEGRWTPTIAGAGLVSTLSLLLSTVNIVFGPLFLLAALVIVVMGLGRPWRDLAAAKSAQEAVLKEAGAPSYLAFHLRRVDASMDPDARLRVDAATRIHREALASWRDVASGIEVGVARAIEAEVGELAASLATAEGDLQVLAQLQDELSHAEAEVRATHQALWTSVRPYGLEVSALDDGDVSHMVATSVSLGHQARAQHAAETARREANLGATALDQMLLQLGYRDGSLDERVEKVESAITRATERVGVATVRSRADVMADVQRLEAEVAHLHRPEWNGTSAADYEPMDVDELASRRRELEKLIAADEDVVIDLERLADRHSAMERRVASLEARHNGAAEETTIGQLADLQQYLLAHLTAASNVGPFAEALPVVMDEPFLRVSAERKWELLDMLRRLGEKTQLIYLTDDPYVTAWARRRSAAGLVTLLEPIDA